MSRFDGDGDWDFGRWSIWDRAVHNAFMGPKAISALADLEEALVALPEPRLIESRVAENGEVCAIGAYALSKRVAKGDDRVEVLAELERRYHPEEYFSGDETACLGQYHGMTYCMAWRIAEMNDEDCRGFTPERRYLHVLNFVRRAQGKEPIAAVAA